VPGGSKDGSRLRLLEKANPEQMEDHPEIYISIFVLINTPTSLGREMT